MAPRSLSIVFGTPTTGTPCSPSTVATPSVSSPPITISASTPRPARLSLIRSMPLRPPLPVLFSGLVRDDPRIVPPRGRMPRTACTSSGIVSPSSGPRHPSRNPTNSRPYSCTPLRTTARITAFKPGQSPPPVRTPTRMAITIVGESRARMACGASRGKTRPGERLVCAVAARLGVITLVRAMVPLVARAAGGDRCRGQPPAASSALARRASMSTYSWPESFAMACMISSVMVRSSWRRPPGRGSGRSRAARRT